MVVRKARASSKEAEVRPIKHKRKPASDGKESAKIRAHEATMEFENMNAGYEILSSVFSQDGLPLVSDNSDSESESDPSFEGSPKQLKAHCTRSSTQQDPSESDSDIEEHLSSLDVDSESSDIDDWLQTQSPIEVWELARRCDMERKTYRQAVQLYELALEKFGEICPSMTDASGWLAYGECLVDAFWCTNDKELLLQAGQVISRAIELDIRKEFAQPFLYLAQIRTLLAICNSDTEESCRHSCYDSLKYLRQSFTALALLSSKKVTTSPTHSYISDLANIAIECYEENSPFSAVSPPLLLLQIDTWIRYISTIYRASCLSVVSEERSHSLLQLCLDQLLQIRHVLVEIKSRSTAIPIFCQLCQLNTHLLESRCLASLALLFKNYFREHSHARRYCDLGISSLEYCKKNVNLVLTLTLVDQVDKIQGEALSQNDSDPISSSCTDSLSAAAPCLTKKKSSFSEKSRHKDIDKSEHDDDHGTDMPLAMETVDISVHLTQEEKLTLKSFLNIEPHEIYALAGDLKALRSTLTVSEDDAKDWMEGSLSDYRQGLVYSPNDRSLHTKLHASLALNNDVDDEDDDEEDDEDYNDLDMDESSNEMSEDDILPEAIQDSMDENQEDFDSEQESDEQESALEDNTDETDMEQELQDLLDDVTDTHAL